MLRRRFSSSVPSLFLPRTVSSVVTASKSFKSTHSSSSVSEEDIHWYTKIWKERAIDGGSSQLKRLSTEKRITINDDVDHPSPECVTRNLRLLTQCQNELDLTHALPDILCAQMVEFYHGLSSPHDENGHNKNNKINHYILMDHKIQFVVDLISFAPLRKDALIKQVAKLNEYVSQFVNQEEKISTSPDSQMQSQMKMQSRVSSLVRSLHQSTDPLHEAWMKRMCSLPSGTKVMIDFRSDLLEMKSHLSSFEVKNAEEINLATSTKILAVDTALESLTRILRRWFSTSWMLVEELTWHNTTAAVVEQVMRHEAVHRFIPPPGKNANNVTPMQLVKLRKKPTKNRSLFAFFHPHVPQEPIVMLQVAYTFGGKYASSVDRILSREPPSKTVSELHPEEVYMGTPKQQQPDTAIFYSISSTQKGLAGIELGKHLIKRAVQQILVENNNNNNHEEGGKNISYFSTLSPIPGYSKWAMSNAQKLVLESSTNQTKYSRESIVGDFTGAFFVPASSSNNKVITESALKIISLLDEFAGRTLQNVQEAVSLFWTIMNNFTGVFNHHNQQHVNAQSSAFLPCFFASHFNKSDEKELSRICHKLMTDKFVVSTSSNQHRHQYDEKQLSTPTTIALWTHHDEFAKAVCDFLQHSVKHYLVEVKRRGMAYDPVAHFHLRNGADIFRINPLADCTTSGSSNSCCFMVNYEYELDKIDARSLEYENKGNVLIKF